MTVAEDGPTGLAAAREVDPDLIVLDVMLPGLSGLEICTSSARKTAPPCRSSC